jgi:hypothetical protein
MPRFRRRSWSPEELRLLNELVVAGASPRTAAEALNRAKEIVRAKARMIGCPFPHRDEIKHQYDFGTIAASPDVPHALQTLDSNLPPDSTHFG